jgi:hypothetical protein
VLQSALVNFLGLRGKTLFQPYFRTVAFAAILVTASFSFAAAQDKPTKKGSKKPKAVAAKDAAKPVTAEAVTESAITIYGGLGGRATLDQIRKTAIERGKISVINDAGQMDQASYQKWVVRGENLGKEKIRMDHDFASVRYALVFSDDKIFGVYNDAVFSPRADATKAFQNRIYHGLDALLRYKEDGSTLALAGHDKMMGVDFYFIDVTDKQSRKTRFYISSKTFRVMTIEYEEEGVKYRRKFYDYNYAQGTLVPFRTTLTADEKVVEESTVSTVTFGQKIDDDLFKAAS